jgi:paraquat-inducible protein B
MDHTSQLVADLSAVAVETSDAHVAQRASVALRRLDGFLVEAKRVAERVNAARVPDEVSQTLEALDVALSQLDEVLQRAGGDEGLLASAQRATDAVGDVARSSHGLGREVDATLQSVRQTAATVRRLADALDRNPDMLVKGRAKDVP